MLDLLVVDPDLDYNVAITLRNTDVALLRKGERSFGRSKIGWQPDPTFR